MSIKPNTKEPVRIKVSEIPFFEGVPKGFATALAPYFQIYTTNGDKNIIEQGERLNALHIVIAGEIELRLPGKTEGLQTLSRGASFGELSLVDEEISSFDFFVASEYCTLIYCTAENAKKFLAQKPRLGAAFYAGIANRLSRNLKKTTMQIEDETKNLKGQIVSMIQENRLDQRLEETQMTVNKTGAAMFNKVSEAIEALDSVNAGETLDIATITKIKNELQQVLIVDSQNFDLISQQIDLVHKYIKNIQRFLLEQRLETIRGDFNLSELIEQSDEEVEFF